MMTVRRLCMGLWLLSASVFVHAHEAERNVIDLSAEVRREVANDLMSATVFVESSDDDPTDVSRTVNGRLDEAMKQLRGVSGIRVESGNYSAWQAYVDGRAADWHARAELRLESREFERLSSVIAGLQEKGLQMGGLQFSVSPERRATVENELISEALAAFRVRADIARKALQAQRYDVQRVSLNTQSMATPMVQGMPMLKAEAVAYAPAPAAEGGVSAITVVASGSVVLVP